MTDKPHPAAIDVSGAWYLRDTKSNLVPFALVKPEDLLMDELVRSKLAIASWLSAALSAFKQHAFEEIAGFQELLAQQHGTTIGGRRGNITLTSYDGCAKIQLAVADLIQPGPELQVAKQLIDECLREWSADSRDEIRALVDRVFDVDKEGQISLSGLLQLLRVPITDARWLRGMQAIRDSMRVIGSRSYVRFYTRSTANGPWQAVTLGLASA